MKAAEANRIANDNLTKLIPEITDKDRILVLEKIKFRAKAGEKNASFEFDPRGDWGVIIRELEGLGYKITNKYPSIFTYISWGDNDLTLQSAHQKKKGRGTIKRFLGLPWGWTSIGKKKR